MMSFAGSVTIRPSMAMVVVAPLVVGFGADRGYPFGEFFDDAAAVGLRDDVRLATWDLRPFDDTASFLVAILSPA